MVTNEMVAEMIQGKRPAFIFTFGGMVQFWQQDHNTGMIVATSRQAADVMAADLTKKKGATVSVAEIGIVQDETLAGHMVTAVLENGATGVFVTEDGKQSYYFEAPPAPNEG
jgi:hypothetical protein